MNKIDCDYLVIGSGIAGLSFALRAGESGKVLIVTKSALAETNTSYAQGGIAAAIGEDDSWELHEEDTISAGAGLCDPEAVRFLVQNARPRLEWLASIGAEFDLTPEEPLPRLSLGQEGGHSRKRIVRRADQTGWEIERALTTAARQSERVRIMEHAFCEALTMEGERVSGAIVRPARADAMEIRARAVCLATGSCCQVYRFSTNPFIATGDGLALAASAGAKVENMEFIQFHPTTLYHRQRRGFLISEAVRGEGAILRNLHGRRFMFDYDRRGELAPRDIVARAIQAETLKEGVPFVHLDMTHLAPDEIRERFPFIMRTLLSLGIDVTVEPIPVVPAAHYQCGGVKTDLDGRTSLASLYAAGEVACTGVHGANRLASNSLLEALVFGWAAGEHASASEAVLTDGEPVRNSIPVISRPERDGIVRRLKRLMWENAGIVRRDRGLRHAHEEIREMAAAAPGETEFWVGGAEAANLLRSSLLILEAAMNRRVNVGLHYNVDLGPPQEGARQSAAKA